MTVEELAQAIGDQVEQSARSWLGDLGKSIRRLTV
jgi:hypothetical protein